MELNINTVAVSTLKLLSFVVCSCLQLARKCARHAKAKAATCVAAATEAQYCRVMLVCAPKVIQFFNEALEAFIFAETKKINLNSIYVFNFECIIIDPRFLW